MAADFSPVESASGRRGKRLLRRILIVAGIVLLSLYAMALFSWTQSTAGLVNGRLKPCPSSPNCVCSQAVDPARPDPEHDIEPLEFEGEAGAAWERLAKVLAGLPRVSIVERTDSYLRTEFTTALLRFVDDVEFQLDAANRVIHVRSCSRIGRSDLGTNRRRVETIRERFQAAAQ